LGRPGAGKTTFLKRLAIVCLKGEFLNDRLPVFVTLKEFAETEGQPGIVEFMGSDHTALTQILQAGRALVLLDGLDEVMEKDHDRVIREIRDFAEKYDQNHILITCRIAAQEYILQQFTEVEMADFDDNQIRSFADKWFKTKEDNPESTIGKMFWKELKSRKPVKDLAANPLLLTLLCLEFDNSSAFPQSRSELYERALNVLLAKWDGQRRIKRDNVYKGLSLKRKETLLGQLAMHTFERGDYFFKERVATQQIEQYIRNLPGAIEDLETLMVDSRAVLKSMESQHGLLAERATGIYSFSHLTFQEYFTAKNILDLSNPAAQEAALGNLVEHIGKKRWKEVFLLVVEGLDSADYLLILAKQRIDEIVAGDSKLQQLLEWRQEKSRLVDLTYKPKIVQIFYLVLALDCSLAEDLARDRDRDFSLALIEDNGLDLGLDLALARAGDNGFDLIVDLAIDYANALNPDYVDPFDRAFNSINACNLSLNNAITRTKDLKLKDELKDMQYRLPNTYYERDRLQKWWRQHRSRWTEDLRQITIKYRNIGHDWQFTDEQKTKIQEYYDANLLLINCLNSECYISREVRKEIEATMLLPIASIEKWKAENRPT
jgi:predicted NACHT family NTPase